MPRPRRPTGTGPLLSWLCTPGFWKAGSRSSLIVVLSRSCNPRLLPNVRRPEPLPRLQSCPRRTDCSFNWNGWPCRRTTALSPELKYFVLHSPFAEMLRGFLMDQAWIPDDSGFSILELYIFFTHITGWLVPINICGWDNNTRPPALRSRSAQACWAHETDWDRLALMRQPLNVQRRTFLFILRELFRYMQVPWEITLKRSLHHLGHAFPVQTLPYRPHATCDGNSMQRLQGLQQGGTLVSCLTRGYSVVTSPRPPPRPLGSFDLIWNRRKAYTK